MAVKEVLKMGHKGLWACAEEVTKPFGNTLQLLVQDLIDTMLDYDGVGLAAPQIGVLKRVVVFGVDKCERYPDVEPIPRTVLINPVISAIGDVTEEDWEGCLSVPGMKGRVPRYRTIKYTGYDEAGNEISRIVEGFHARVVQHEVDHLDGIIYPLRITDLHNFGFSQDSFPAE
ncbi:Peptide deformylase [hydrothermal vent metagenome]|uniref:Peptide deformylase n=1 Tax=hydrothermal vent metagenome TaxID=652676 RepID=A0A3B0Z4E0_9ZZZZ